MSIKTKKIIIVKFYTSQNKYYKSETDITALFNNKSLVSKMIKFNIIKSNTLKSFLYIFKEYDII